MNINKCEQQYFKEISLLIDAEISEESKLEITRHLKSCKKCKKRYDILTQLKESISNLEQFSLSDEEKTRLLIAAQTAVSINRRILKSTRQNRIIISLSSAAAITILILATTIILKLFPLSNAPTLTAAQTPTTAALDIESEVEKTASGQDTFEEAAPTGETSGELRTAEAIDFPIFVDEDNSYNTTKFKEAKKIIDTAEKLYQKLVSNGPITQQELISKLKDSLASAQLNSEMIPTIFNKNIEEIANSDDVKDEIVISESTRNLLPFYAEKAIYEGDNSLIIAYFLKPEKDLYYNYLLVPVANSINTGEIQDLTTIKK